MKKFKYRINFKYRYGTDYVHCNKYKVDDLFLQPLNKNGSPMCTIARTNIISILEL